ncbi:MAG TPA: hypothetical protein PKA60_01090 [Candidatus Paceibacterota bacterium]|nr:hypothetical protein [Candidatus Paceibacterota bacterium]
MKKILANKKILLLSLIFAMFLSTIPFGLSVNKNSEIEIGANYTLANGPVINPNRVSNPNPNDGGGEQCGNLLTGSGAICAIKEGIGWVAAQIGYWLLELVSYLLYLGGMLLNASVYFGILKMGSIVRTDAVVNAWSIIRDLINMLFIFGLLYISINTILKGFNENSKHLANIIFAALFINFSFFFTSVLIDGSNILSKEIYNSMNCAQVEGSNNRSDGSAIFDNGISVCFMTALKLNTIYSVGSSVTSTDSATRTGDSLDPSITGSDWARKTDWQKAQFYFLASIFVIIAAIIFMAMAVIVIARFITLIFLLILSPVMFAGMILPKLQEHSDAWWKKLTAMLISMPVMFLMLFMTIAIIETPGGIFATVENQALVADQSATFSGLLQNGSSSASVFINFIIIIGFLIGTMVVAKKTGAAGAGFAMGAVGMALGGVAGFALRNTVGMAGAGLRNVSQKYGKNNMVGRFAGRLGDSAAKSSFDFRNSRAAELLKKVPGAGIDLGEGSKRNWNEKTWIGNRMESIDKQNKELYGGKDESEMKSAQQRAKEAARAMAEDDSTYRGKQKELVVHETDKSEAEKRLEKAKEDLVNEKAKAKANNTVVSKATEDRLASAAEQAMNDISKATAKIETTKQEANKIMSGYVESNVKMEFAGIGISSKKEVEKAVKSIMLNQDQKNQNDLLEALKNAQANNQSSNNNQPKSKTP